MKAENVLKDNAINFIVVLVFVLASVIFTFHLINLREKITEKSAIENAELYFGALKKFLISQISQKITT